MADDPNTTPRLYSLSDQDADALDILMEAHAGMPPLRLADENPSVSPVNIAKTRQGQNLLQIMSLLAKHPARDPAADLVQRTLIKISDDQKRQGLLYQTLGVGGGGNSFGLSEFITVAAVIMISFSLIWPALENNRTQARQLACARNLAATGAAIGQYAADHRNTLPRGQVTPGSVWWNVGHGTDEPEGPIQSNSAHLYLLIRGGYAHPQSLTCPENSKAPHHLNMHAHDWQHPEAVSYSYQNQYTASPYRLDKIGDMVILGDKNPLFTPNDPGIGLRYRDDLSDSTASPAHGGRGQNVLAASGSVLWRDVPVMDNGDNIWLIEGVRSYNGTETPHIPHDTFLVP